MPFHVLLKYTPQSSILTIPDYVTHLFMALKFIPVYFFFFLLLSSDRFTSSPCVCVFFPLTLSQSIKVAQHLACLECHVFFSFGLLLLFDPDVDFSLFWSIGPIPFFQSRLLQHHSTHQVLAKLQMVKSVSPPGASFHNWFYYVVSFEANMHNFGQQHFYCPTNLGHPYSWLENRFLFKYQSICLHH